MEPRDFDAEIAEAQARRRTLVEAQAANTARVVYDDVAKAWTPDALEAFGEEQRFAQAVKAQDRVIRQLAGEQAAAAQRRANWKAQPATNGDALEMIRTAIKAVSNHYEPLVAALQGRIDALEEKLATRARKGRAST